MNRRLNAGRTASVRFEMRQREARWAEPPRSPPVILIGQCRQEDRREPVPSRWPENETKAEETRKKKRKKTKKKWCDPLVYCDLHAVRVPASVFLWPTSVDVIGVPARPLVPLTSSRQLENGGFSFVRPPVRHTHTP